MTHAVTPLDKPFLMGFCALIFWAISAVLIAGLMHMPALEGLAISLSMPFFAAIIRLTLTQRWHTLREQNTLAIVLITVALMGNHLCYYLSFHYAPAAEVDLIFYSWPLLNFAVLLFKKQIPFRWQSLLILSMGFCALLLISPGAYEVSGYPYSALGWLIAGVGTLCWVTYSICSQDQPQLPMEMVSLAAGGSLVIALTCSDFSSWIMPSSSDWARLIALGTLVYTLGYWGWDWAVKKGRLQHLTLVANTTPILSVFLLCFFGYTTWSWQIVLAAILLVVSLCFVQKKASHA